MKFSLSSLSILIVAITCFAINFSFDRFKRTKDVIKDDVVIYYEYLPLKFIYDDLKVEKHYGIDSTKDCIIWVVQTPEGKNVIKMTMGLAILYSPFFFIANFIAQTFGYTADGYSQPYTIMLLFSTIFYLLLGLHFLKKTLKHFLFSDSTIAITILLLGLGTNLLCYASQSAPMPHVYLFCMISAFFYYTTQWYKSTSIKNSLLIGLTAGLISLIRPSDLLIVILFILYGVSNFADIRSRTIFYRKNIFPLFLIVVSAFLIWLPQLIYWKTTTGHYLYYSYNRERFFFMQPRILEGLFSFRKGWLLYTPMMIFALAGLFLLKDEIKKIRLGLVTFVLLNIYITFSWWCWWYGGAFGLRAMIDSYALMSLPLASTIHYIRNKKFAIRIAFFTTAIFFIWLNLLQTYQFEKRILRYDGINRKLYFKIFGKREWIPECEDLASSIDAREAMLGRNGLDANEPVRANFISQDTVRIQSKSGRFVSLNEHQYRVDLKPTGELPGENEIFVFKKLANDQCAITAHNNLYLSADLNRNAEVFASETNMVLWETFTIVKVDSNFIAIKASNGKYFSVSENSSQLVAKGETIGESETFKVVPK